jgi:acetyltransferase
VHRSPQPRWRGGISATVPDAMSVTLAGGRTCRIRPIRASDRELKRDFLADLSARARYNRFLGAVRELSPEALERLVRVDYRSQMALVALTGEGSAERIVGVARYAAATGSCSCELSIVVADGWQRRGLAAILSSRLLEYARLSGLARVTVCTLADNVPMIRLAQRLGMRPAASQPSPSIIEMELAFPEVV